MTSGNGQFLGSEQGEAYPRGVEALLFIDPERPKSEALGYPEANTKVWGGSGPWRLGAKATTDTEILNGVQNDKQMQGQRQRQKQMRGFFALLRMTSVMGLRMTSVMGAKDR